MRHTENRILPGVITLTLCIVVWQGVSMFFLPVVFPGPVALLDRMVAIYSDPASYLIVAQTLERIFEGFVISMVAGHGVRPDDGTQTRH